MCISGHHRIKAAVKAGITTVPALIINEVDESTRIRLQLSHNDIHGEPDDEILKVLQRKLNEIDLSLINKLANEAVCGMKEVKIEKIDFKYVSICLLPESFEALQKLIELVEGDEKWIIEKPEYEDLKIALTRAFKVGFKTPGRAFRKFMDIVLTNKEMLNEK